MAKLQFSSQTGFSQIQDGRTVEAGAPGGSTAHRDLRTELKKAYDHLCMFEEFQHGRVEIRRLYYQIKKTNTHLEVAGFHKELLDMSRQRVVELHVLNEVKEAKDRELAIEREGRLLYYVMWN